jgi:nucleoid-associated protein YgaU
MGKLERAKIFVLPGNGENKGESDATDGIDVCFNPKEYSLEKSLDWEAEKAFSDSPQPEFKAPKPMTLSVTLQFDSYEERVSVRDKWVRKIERLTMMAHALPKDGKKASPTDKQKNRPPVILFVWGRFSFKGVIESLSQKYTMFLSDGTPVRAECGLKIRNVLTSQIDEGTSQKFSKKRGDAAKKNVEVKQNDRLDLIAARHLGDAGRWPEIAALNDIVDPALISKDGKERLTHVDIPED